MLGLIWSCNSFLARILPNDKADTGVPVPCGDTLFSWGLVSGAATGIGFSISTTGSFSGITGSGSTVIASTAISSNRP